jgi:lipoprotein-anchoring transpeptidase ErfK/SrfK
MSNRTGLIALAAAALMMIGSTAPAGAREVVRYTAEVQPGTIVVKTAERRLYLVLGGGEAIRYTVAVGRPSKQWQGQGPGERQVRAARLDASRRSESG